MKGKKISAIKLSVLIVMFVMLVATVLYDHFYVVERNLPGYVKEYERYTSFSGVIDDIEAWRLSDTDDSSPVFERVSSAYITLLSPNLTLCLLINSRLYILSHALCLYVLEK